ncbi:hypothetical protein [Candidatus Poriferisodalis sp.]|uniref:hypothetical protein n=1 Tax=Candidatus Poriferisodalis sp. TaxID=3101277 RepID=UPI003B5C0FBE
MARAVSLPISEDLAERLRAEGEASDLPPPVLAASLMDEGLKTRQFPGIVYMDGPSGRRASLADGPDVWQIIRALQEVPADQHDPVETVCIESDLHERQVDLAVRFFEAYPDEIEAKIEDNRAAATLIDEMIAERDQAVAQGNTAKYKRAKTQRSYSGPSL